MIPAALLPVDGLHALVWAAECLEHATPAAAGNDVQHRPATRTGGRAVNSAIQLIIYERDLSIEPLQQAVPVQIPEPAVKKKEDALQGSGVKRKWSPAWATQSLTSQVNKYRLQTSPVSTGPYRIAVNETSLHTSSRSSTPPPPGIMLDPSKTPVAQPSAIKLNLARSTARQVQPSRASATVPALCGIYAGTSTKAGQPGGRTPFGKMSHDPPQQETNGVLGDHSAAVLPAASTWQSESVPETSFAQASVDLTQGRAVCAARQCAPTRYAPTEAGVLSQSPQQQQSASPPFSHTATLQAAIFRSSCNLHLTPIHSSSMPDHPNGYGSGLVVGNHISQQNTTGSGRQQGNKTHYEQQQQQLKQQQELQQNLQQQLQQQQTLQLQNLKQQLQDLQKLQQVIRTPPSFESGFVKEFMGTHGLARASLAAVDPANSGSASQTVSPTAQCSSPCSAASLSDTSHSHPATKGSARQLQDLADAAAHDMDMLLSAGFGSDGIIAPAPAPGNVNDATETLAASTARISKRLQAQRRAVSQGVGLE